MPYRDLTFAAALLVTAALAPPLAAQPSSPGDTANFLHAAVQSDTYEINAAEVAIVEGRSSPVRAFAQQMLQDHRQTSAALKAASSTSGLTPPEPGLGDDGQRFLAALQSQRGAEFDRAYARQQVLAHQQALVVAQAYAADGHDRNIKQAAQSEVPIIQHHLEMARRLQASLGAS